MSTKDSKVIDRIVRSAIEQGACPGAHVLIGNTSGALYDGCFGFARVVPNKVPMERDMVFDCASLTKCMATAPAINLLVQRGVLKMDESIARYLPEFASERFCRNEVTSAHLLMHAAGFRHVDTTDFSDGWFGRAVEECHVRFPGQEFEYTDLAYITLGMLVEKVTGEPLNHFVEREIFIPLGMDSTMFMPLNRLKPVASQRLVPTTWREGEHKFGIVHDPTATAMGGVAGHAGVFSSAYDIALFCNAMLGESQHRPRLFEADSLNNLTTAFPTDRKLETFRTLGFDSVSKFDRPRGRHFAKSYSFGHSGFTGTSLWIDKPSGMYVIILTSRLHPDGKGDVKQLRYDVATAAAEVFLGYRS